MKFLRAHYANSVARQALSANENYNYANLPVKSGKFIHEQNQP